VLNSARDDGSWASTKIFTVDLPGQGQRHLRHPEREQRVLPLPPGTGKATSEIFGTPQSLGTGFRQYDSFG